MDDSIENIKLKIFLSNPVYPIEEMYLFSSKEEYVSESSPNIYKTFGDTVSFEPGIYYVMEPLGQDEKEYPANPFQVTNIQRDHFFSNVNRKNISNNYVKNNNIYLCYLENVRGESGLF